MQALEAEAEMGEDDRDTKARTGGDRSREGRVKTGRWVRMRNRRDTERGRRRCRIGGRGGTTQCHRERGKREETEQPERPWERRDARRCGE